ncbi:hypothetical protein V6N12_052476 [Hibiscus sabdariffa]|uniref:Uncharacterized protein n=1 Tax=Hibiscus sabdariffa TaxID=183260 RepID=A0ABR2C1X3_9ROSI
MKTSELSWNSQGETPLEIKPSIENMLKEGRSKNSAEEDPLAEAKATVAKLCKDRLEVLNVPRLTTGLANNVATWGITRRHEEWSDQSDSRKALVCFPSIVYKRITGKGYVSYRAGF